MPLTLTALLFAHSSNYRCKIVEHNKRSDMANNSAVESERYLICHLSIFRCYAHTACVLIYVSLEVTTSS